MSDLSLEEVINNILSTQYERISEYLVNGQKGFPERGVDEEDIPEVSVGYGFYNDDHKYNLKVTLEKEFD